jgi:hypothetical protein
MGFNTKVLTELASEIEGIISQSINGWRKSRDNLEDLHLLIAGRILKGAINHPSL